MPNDAALIGRSPARMRIGNSLAIMFRNYRVVILVTYACTADNSVEESGFDTSLDFGALRSCNAPKSREQWRQCKAARLVPPRPAQVFESGSGDPRQINGCALCADLNRTRGFGGRKYLSLASVKLALLVRIQLHKDTSRSRAVTPVP